MRWFPLAPNRGFSAFEKRLHKTEKSLNVVDSVKRSGGLFLSEIEAGKFVKSHILSQFKNLKT